MKKKSVNRKVMSSIGVSLLATVTTCTNVYAAAPALVEDGNSVEAQVFSIENEPVTSSAATQGSSKMQDELEETPVLSGESSVKEELDKAQEAVGATGEEKPLEEAVNNIGGALEEAQEAVDHVKTDIENLDDLNQKADKAVENYTEKVEDPEAADLIETWADNVEKANESAEAANEQASEAKDNAEQILEDVTAAQSNSNRSEEEAAAAQLQAQDAAQKAQEEYEKAQAAQEAAQKEVTEAEDSFKAVEEAYSEAQKAYENAATAVENAQKALEAIKGNGEIEIDGVTYKGNSKEAQDAAQKAMDEAKEALKIAGKNLDVATQDVNKAKDKLSQTTEKLENVNEILVNAEHNKEEAYKDLADLGNEAITNAQNSYKDATDQLSELDSAIDEKTKADQAVAEAGEELQEKEEAVKNCTDDKVQKLIDEEKAVVEKYNELKDSEGFDRWQRNNEYYKAANTLAVNMIKDKLEKAGMEKISTGRWSTVGGTNNHYVKVEYEENGNERVAYFDYIDGDDGRISVVQKSQEYKDASGNVLTTVIDNGKTVFKLNGVEIENTDEIKYNRGVGTTVSFSYGGKLYIGGVNDFAGENGGKGADFYTAKDLTDYTDKLNAAIAARDDAQKKLEDANGVQKAANDELSDKITNVKNNGLAADEISDDDISAIRDAVSGETDKRAEALDNAVKGYADALRLQQEADSNNLCEKESQKDNIKNRNDQLKNVIASCSQVIDIVKKINGLQAQADVSREQLDQLEAKRDKVKGNYDNASKTAEAAAELVTQAGEAAAEAMRIAGLDFLFTSASTTPTIPTTPTTPDGGGTGTTDPDNGGGTGTTDPGYGGDGTGTDVGGTGTTDVAAAEDTGATTPGGADMMADGSDATALVATAAVLPDGAEPIALAAGGNMNAGAAAGVDAGEATDDEADGLRVVEEEEVPLANADLESIDEDAEEESAEVRQIEDEETPLADLDLETEKSRMSWWWLLIIAVCGATGYEMYKKHKKKMEAENAMK